MTVFRTALDELAAVTAAIDPVAIDAACSVIARANRIVLYGCGRESLQLQGFAMRLHHMGARVAMQGAMNAPPIGPGDLFICSAGPGELATVSALMRLAHLAGADILFLTAEPDTPASRLATHLLTIPAQTMARDRAAQASRVLPMGSTYEGALFLLFEIMVHDLARRLNITPAAMRARHTNLE